mgnify:CR=1 FL=1|jgi:hypothetical protein
MKKELKTHIRKRIIAGLSVLFLALLGMAGWNFLQPRQAEKDVPLYQYTQQAQVNYQVHFLPNNFFPEKSAGPGRAYITSLTDFIETRLDYQISGERPADVKGEVEVAAVLTGYIYRDKAGSQSGEKEKIVVWSKTTPLLETTPYNGNSVKTELTKVVRVDLNQYKKFADQVNAEFKSPAELVELVLIYGVSAHISTDQGKSDSKVSPQLVIPIKGNTFIVGGALADKKDNAITQKKMVEVPGAQTGRMVYGGLALVAGLLLLATIFGTDVELEDPLEKELRRIINKFGERIVEVGGAAPRVAHENRVELNSFDDLVKVASEVARPILFEDTGKAVYKFYVINEPYLFSYALDAFSVAEWDSSNTSLDVEKESL